ncbi:MAG: hypothetical protein GX896_02680 [Clostridiales bacterium]|nr:hypothetical protein [Clostridiales bacterium]
MFLIIPKKVHINSEYTTKKYLSEFEKNTSKMREKGVFRVSKHIKSNWETPCYYGSRKENKITVFYHHPKKRDGGGARFNGQVLKTQSGCEIEGYIRQSAVTYILALVWTIIFALFSLVFLVDGSKNAILTLSLLVIGIFIFFWSGNKPKHIKAYLEVLGEKETTEKPKKSKANEKAKNKKDEAERLKSDEKVKDEKEITEKPKEF